jgi:hypothetical protein
MPCACLIWSRGLPARLAAGTARMSGRLGRAQRNMPDTRQTALRSRIILQRRQLPPQPSDDLIRFEWIKAVAVKALECALALASGRKRQCQKSPAIRAFWSFCMSHDLDFVAVLGARLFQRKFGGENVFCGPFVPKAEHPPCSLLGARPPIG